MDSTPLRALQVVETEYTEMVKEGLIASVSRRWEDPEEILSHELPAVRIIRAGGGELVAASGRHLIEDVNFSLWVVVAVPPGEEPDDVRERAYKLVIDRLYSTTMENRVKADQVAVEHVVAGNGIIDVRHRGPMDLVDEGEKEHEMRAWSRTPCVARVKYLRGAL
jgi:hypothetical protein